MWDANEWETVQKCCTTTTHSHSRTQTDPQERAQIRMKNGLWPMVKWCAVAGAVLCDVRILIECKVDGRELINDCSNKNGLKVTGVDYVIVVFLSLKSIWKWGTAKNERRWCKNGKTEFSKETVFMLSWLLLLLLVNVREGVVFTMVALPLNLAVKVKSYLIYEHFSI